MTPNPNQKQKVEYYLGIAGLLLVLLGCIAVIRPFISALLWAGIICYTTWPAYVWLKKFTGGSDATSAAIMTFLIALIMLMPFVMVAVTLAENLSKINDIVDALRSDVFPLIPIWLEKIPKAGPNLVDYWNSFAADSGKIISYLRDFIINTHSWFFKRIFDIGSGIFQLSLSVFACYFFLP
ncbi:MAG TPA: AI-2E family transporter [Victivallales bacterium]|nr:AI-2E family transporter [Victivallales bacterium]